MSDTATREVDAVIVGAGFAGLYQLHRLRQLGLSAQVIEAGDGVGGTWYWNRYPGARCDIESLDYQYGWDDQLATEWKWTERYATQPEILRYVNHVADRFDLRRDVLFQTRVVSAHFNDATNRWTVTTDGGQVFSASYCIMATGCLSAARVPDFKGRDLFKGETYHTGQWPHEGVDFTGKRVGIIGTGSSGIQSIPLIAKQAAHLTVFQRTPNFSVPAHNGEINPQHKAKDYKHYSDYRKMARSTTVAGVPWELNNQSALEATPEERTAQLEERWRQGGFVLLTAFNDLSLNPEANEVAAEFVRSKIRATVKDPVTAEQLCPRDYPFGTKRLCVDTEYFETYNRSNVALVDIKNSPITEITEHGIKTANAEYEFDAIIFATGFDAMTGALLNIDIRGREGVALKDKWEHGPRNYLGIQPAGFPNLFTITGPGSPSVLTNMLVAIEQHVEWVTDAIKYLNDHELGVMEATTEAEDQWVDQVNALADMTLYPRANSWYIGANVPGKPRVFMPYIGGMANYSQKCQDVAANGYEGFALKTGV